MHALAIGKILPPAEGLLFFDEGNMEELRKRLDEIRERVIRLDERGEASADSAVNLRDCVEDLEKRVRVLEMDTARLGVKMAVIVAVALLASQLIPKVFSLL